MHMMLLLLLLAGCTSLTSGGARVTVYQAPLDAPPASRTLAGPCRLIDTLPPVSITELEMVGTKDPFPGERNQAAAAGANTLVVLTKMLIPRHDMECPASSPITDCPPSSGAWYTVVFERYACPPGAPLPVPGSVTAR
jgi:hypothetical protein